MKGDAMLSTRTIVVRAGVTAVEVMLAVLLVGGLTPADFTLNALQALALAGAGAGLSVLYNAARQWLEQSAAGRRLQALRAERDRQLAEQERAAVALDTDDEDPGEILDLSAGTRRPRWHWPGR